MLDAVHDGIRECPLEFGANALTNASPQRPFLGYYAPRFLTWELCVLF